MGRILNICGSNPISVLNRFNQTNIVDDMELKQLGLAALILVAVFAASVYGFMAVITPPVQEAPMRPPPPSENRSGELAPDFTLPIYGGGGDLSLHDLWGRPIILAFINPYCPFSQIEAPILSQLHEKYGDEIEFILISDQEEGLDDYVEMGNITFTVVVDETGAVSYTHLTLPTN